MNLCDIDTIRDVLRRHGFRFSRSLGQNFLTDASVPQRIAEQSGAAEIKNVVEIGPGMGCLTAELCRSAGEGGLAAAVETAGTVLALAVALPLVQGVMELMAEMLL